jgi:hypothetical protein
MQTETEQQSNYLSSRKRTSPKLLPFLSSCYHRLPSPPTASPPPQAKVQPSASPKRRLKTGTLPQQVLPAHNPLRPYTTLSPPCPWAFEPHNVPRQPSPRLLAPPKRLQSPPRPNLPPQHNPTTQPPPATPKTRLRKHRLDRRTHASAPKRIGAINEWESGSEEGDGDEWACGLGS